MPPVTIAWQSSDLSKFESTLAPTSAPTKALSSPSSTSTSSIETKAQQSHEVSIPARPTSDDNNALTGAAVAGIGVGAAVGVLLIAGLIIWVLFKHRKQRKQRATESSYGRYAEGHGRVYDQYGRKDGLKFSEMEDSTTWPELSPGSTRYELAGGPHFSRK